MLLRKERLSVPNLIGSEWVLWFWTNQCAQIWVIMPTHSDSQSYHDHWGERTVDQPQPWQCSAVSIVALNLRNIVLPFHGLISSRDAGTSRGAAEGHSAAHQRACEALQLINWLCILKIYSLLLDFTFPDYNEDIALGAL